MSNSDNPKKGAEFQRQVQHWFAMNYGVPFELEVPIPIGSKQIDPRDFKEHKFDLANEDRTIVIECKRYTWTETGNVPSAKMGFTNEAAFYLSLLNETKEKYIVMLKSNTSKRSETLAEYYHRTNKHLLGDIVIAEYDPGLDEMRFL